MHDPEDFDPKIPAHDAPLTAFGLGPGEKRDTAIAWARGVLAEVAHFNDETIIRACKVIEANDKAFYLTAFELRRFLETCVEDRSNGGGNA